MTIRYNFMKIKNPNSFYINFFGIENVLTIVSTDYNNYAIVYGCHDIGLAMVYNTVILGRNRTMNNDTMTNLIDEVRNKLNESDLKKIDQSNC